MGHEDGSGIRRMRIMMTEAHLTVPTFESNRGANTFTIRLLLHHFLGEEDLKWLTRFDRYGLNDNQKKALIFLREAGAVNNLVFRQLSGLDTLHASSALREMRDEGIIVQKGAGNATYYVPGEIILQREDETLQDDGKRLLDNESWLLDNEARLLDNERIENSLKTIEKTSQTRCFGSDCHRFVQNPGI